ncbi:MAG: DUF3500 domain-containing protein [Pirellulales bacterium]
MRKLTRARATWTIGLLAVLTLLTGLQHAWAKIRAGQSAAAVTAAATKLVQSASAEQQAKLIMPFDTPQRLDWHFIPKDNRKGLEMNAMSDQQRAATRQLLQGLLSQIGYHKAEQIIHFENLLKEIEKGSGPLRDPQRYFLTFFGQPGGEGRWGISFEGHHLSLNFVLEGGQVVSSSPQALASNPAIVQADNTTGIAKGTRILELEETLAFQLVKSLTAEQKKVAVVADKAPREVTAVATPQPPQTPAEGITAADLTAEQQKLLFKLIDVYIDNVPEDVAAERREAVEQAGRDGVRFAWSGPLEPGIGHYYRIQGPTFWIEFVNTQPDVMGNPANHIHCIWRDMRGDFGLPAKS